MARLDPRWEQSGLHENQIVECVVTAHRDHYGVDVEVVSPPVHTPAFIDFVLLAEPGTEVTPADFPPVGEHLTAVTLNFMPWGELRLSARPSSITRAEVEGP